jgi:hypothetical protein
MRVYIRLAGGVLYFAMVEDTNTPILLISCHERREDINKKGGMLNLNTSVNV